LTNIARIVVIRFAQVIGKGQITCSLVPAGLSHYSLSRYSWVNRTMRSLYLSPVILALCAAVPVSANDPQQPGNAVELPSGTFEVSFAAGSRDKVGRFMGGTEMRVLASHAGKLYAGNGYWEDRGGPEGPQGAQVLVLDGPGARWRVDHDFDDRMPNGRPRDLAVSALREVHFSTDWQGTRLPNPVALLLAANWDLTGTTRAFARDDATGVWSVATLAHDPPNPNFLPQVRSFGEHRDQVTRIDLVFAGQDPRGIFSGGYDPTAAGRIRWSAAPELDLSEVSSAGISGRNGYLRVSSFAECNGRLYAAVGQQVYERLDGMTPHWRLVYTNPSPGHSETGLRGLTAMPAPSGQGEVLLAAVEGDAARILRIDPRDGRAATELDLLDFLRERWGMPAGYVIAAYNDMAKAPDPAGGEALLIGIEAFIPLRAALATGHEAVSVGYGRLEAGGWYLVRHINGHYDLRSIPATPGQVLVATRSIRVSAFPQERDAIYFAGYDANKAPVHDSAWIYRSTTAAVIDGR
jgi:hypothetical protein